jgi:[pyruvate, water dikinase]-phosphate phosphotransferase / [pyruvate, water dikinase] kinase
VLAVSDGSGVTGERVIQAAATQFDPGTILVERVSQVRSGAQITRAVSDAAARGATVLYSLVSAEHRRHLLQEAQRHDVFTIDLLGPILRRLSGVLEISPRAEPGLFRQLDEEYFRRIEAIEFAVKHDDGKLTQDLPAADLVVVGVSRSSKTPLSMYLAYRGWRVANVPIVLNLDPPPELYALERTKVIALSAQPIWIEGVRRERARKMAPGLPMSYAELAHIREELQWFRNIVQQGGWTVVEVTHKAVEETAAEIIALVRE